MIGNIFSQIVTFSPDSTVA